MLILGYFLFLIWGSSIRRLIIFQKIPLQLYLQIHKFEQDITLSQKN